MQHYTRAKSKASKGSGKKLKFAKLHKWNTSATSKASKGQWWNLELCDTSATSKASKAKWWNFELLAESLVWHPEYDHCIHEKQEQHREDLIMFDHSLR